MAENSSWDQANRRQTLGLVWRNRKKISQIIKDYFYLLFFLLIIFAPPPHVLFSKRLYCMGKGVFLADFSFFHLDVYEIFSGQGTTTVKSSERKFLAGAKNL
jgi:hypothetical protein